MRTTWSRSLRAMTLYRRDVWLSGRPAARNAVFTCSALTFRTVPSRNGTSRPAIDQRKDFNIADLIFAERWWDRLLGVSRADKCDCPVQSEQGVSTSCTKYQVAT